MIQKPTVKECLSTVLNGFYGGADAFGLQLESMEKSERTDEGLKQIFSAMRQKPAYITNYRYGSNTGLSDDALADTLLKTLSLGATLADIMGDMFDTSPLCGRRHKDCPFPEYTLDTTAIKKQKELIQRIHDMGKEALISCHILEFTPADAVLDIALGLQDRGADIVKIVSAAGSTDQELENLRITALLKQKLRVPFLFLSGGTHYMRHRMFGPFFGCGYYLCAPEHYPGSTPAQPLLSNVRAVLDGAGYMDFF